MKKIKLFLNIFKGEKYMCNGIFFKFAQDISIGNTWLYGGAERSEANSSKCAGHELKA